MLVEIINLYGAEIIGTLLVAVLGVLGMVAKNIASKYLDTDTKRTMARIVVQFVEQTFKEMHGKEKMDAALVALSELLEERNIKASEYEMRIMIEAAVAEFNKAFEKKE